jgi:alkylhydroperoxidase family enzyme
MTETPVEVDDETFAAMRRHFTDEQIIELTAAIAWENYRARANHALGIGSDELYCELPQRRAKEVKAG